MQTTNLSEVSGRRYGLQDSRSEVAICRHWRRIILHFGSFDIAAWIILFGFISAFGCELALLILQPERTWYEGRAVAESVKTLAWRYSVCADPFPKEMSRAEAESNFVNAFHQS